MPLVLVQKDKENKKSSLDNSNEDDNKKSTPDLYHKSSFLIWYPQFYQDVTMG
jgi:hypothetical protein